MSVTVKRSLVPGRRILDEEHACAMAGYFIHNSYMDDKTIVEAEVTVDLMDDTMERRLRKEGKSDWEITEIRKRQNDERRAKADANLQKQAGGTDTFSDLLKVYNYRARPDENIEESDEEIATSSAAAIPKLPADQKRGDQILSSTPKNPNQTLRSLRALDISRVENSEASFNNSGFKQPILRASKKLFGDENDKSAASLQGTFTKSQSLQGTFTKNNKSGASLQGTFTKSSNTASLQGTFTKEPSSQSLQGTFTKENSSESLQGTFTKAADNEEDNDGTFVVKPAETSRNTSKTKLADREKRNISLASSLLESSMLNVADSPGAKLFVSRPKKLRPSTDKSQTIQMESIHEDEIAEQSGATSYASAVTEQDLTSDVSTRKSVNILEKVRDVPKIPQLRLDTKTPTRNYLKPTIASTQKSVHHKTPVSNQIPVNVSTPINNSFEQRNTSIHDRLSRQFEEVADEEEESVGATAVITQGEPVNVSQLSSTSEQRAALNSIERTLDVLNLGGAVGNVSYNDDDGGVEEEEEEEEQGPSRRNTSNQLLDESLATVNTPGIFVRNRGRRFQRNNMDATIEDNTFEEDPTPGSKVMVLGGRSLIKPQAADAGLRRSNRTRVKPLRPWLGEHAVYAHSPSGGKRLVGITEVEVTDRKMIKYKSMDPKVILERQCQEREKKKARAAERRRNLQAEHRRGVNLDTTQEDIVTSDDDE